MTAIMIVGILWLLFAGAHIGLATGAVRQRLVRNLGEFGFTAFFYVLASVTFATLIHFYAQHRFDGPRGLDLGVTPLLGWLLMALIAVAYMLMIAALAIYPRLPTAVFNQSISAPRGLERITRHPFFAGVALFALAHVLVAPHLIGTVFFAALATFVIVGARHQDDKLLARHGEAYHAYVAATSAVPFAAVLSGRQRVVWRELPLASMGIGLALAVALRYGHERIFADAGMWISAVVIGGGLIAGINAWRRARRRVGPVTAPASA